MATFPPLDDVQTHTKEVRRLLLANGVPSRVISAIQTKAYRTGRKVTGEHATNRDARWTLILTHPQYGSEYDCKVIFVKLCAQIFCFDNAPELHEPLKGALQLYLDEPIAPNTYRDKLLLERFDFNDLVAEGLNPVHGHSSFHIGHEDPTQKPKHTPNNVGWRTFRSNLIQGNMTLREARVYFLKLIGRYFELGEIDIA